MSRHEYTTSPNAQWIDAPTAVHAAGGPKGVFMYRGEQVSYCFGVDGYLGYIISTSALNGGWGATVLGGKIVTSTVEGGSRK
jgi:hypothetical protein